MKKIILIIVLLLLSGCAGLKPSGSGLFNNLVFLERFNGALSNWSLYQGGGTVSIVKWDYSSQLQLNDTSGSDNVSAMRSFTEPTGKWLLEYDIYLSSRAAGVMELLSSNDAVVATVACGSRANILAFSTDTVGASTTYFPPPAYEQVVLAVDNQTKTIKAYVTNSYKYPDDYLVQVGMAKAYSGTAIEKVRFRTTQIQRGIVYIDEVKVFKPDWFVIGDSITDGKPLWSNNPETRDRLSGSENSPPQWHLGKFLGGTSNIWVANRAFGSAVSSDIASQIQSNVIDQYAQKVYIGVGGNDIARGAALSTTESNIDSIVSILQKAGIVGSNVILGNIIPRSVFSAQQESKRHALNAWLKRKADTIGAVYVDLAAALRDPHHINTINPLYAYSDGVHLTSAGSDIMARAIFDAWHQKAASLK